jgi:cytochrome P450
MLVAGHETTGSALTWTMYLLAMNPDKMAKAQEEVDRVLSGSKTQPSMADYGELRCCGRGVVKGWQINQGTFTGNNVRMLTLFP